MKEANVLSHLTLVESINKGRQSQIDAISVAVASFQPEPNSRHSKLYSHIAVYLAFFAQWLEKEIGLGMMQLGELKELPNYPGEGQIDFRLANSLGVIEGLNQLGIISSTLIGHSQSALTKASLFAMGRNKNADLPLFSSSCNDELYTDLHACSRAIAEQQILCKNGLQLATSYALQCEHHNLESEMAFAPICASACEQLVAATLKRMAQIANQPFSEQKMFDNDPARHISGGDIMTSRAMAAGIVAGVVTSHIKTKLPWTMINSN
jgi:hypothetical protein